MGVPWLDQPLSLAWHPPNECSLNNTAQCEYQLGYWRNWNIADYHYALPAVAFFLVAIVLFAIANIAEEFLPKVASQSGLARRVKRVARYLSYRNFRISFLDWNSAPLGLLLLGSVGLIYFLCMTLVPQPYYWPNTPTVDHGDQPPIVTRSGWLSIACLPFVFATAGKSNLITGITGVSHEKLQVFHRWISYAFFVTALVHTFPFIIYHISIGDMVDQWNTQIYYWTGVIAIIAQAWLTFASFGPLREWCYEWFKFSHFAAALIFMIFLFFHCDGEFSAWPRDYFVATGVLFSVSWLHRQIRIYFEHGFGHKAELRLEANGFIRASIPTSATWRVGQHFFVRFLTPDLHALTTHPFTACSLPEPADMHDSKANELVFYIRPRGGMTARLARSLEASGQRSLRVLLDGPYGGVDMRKLESSHRTVIIAGGSGAGWTLPIVAAHLRKLGFLTSSGQGDVFPNLRLILATRNIDTKQWFEDAVRDLISTFDPEKRHSLAEVDIFYTGNEPSFERPQLRQRSSEKVVSDEDSVSKAIAAKETISSTSSTSSSNRNIEVRHHTARPDLLSMLNEQGASLNSGTQLGVYVCGPLSMQAYVANAVAAQQLSTMKDGARDIYLHMEHFSWA
ncbi:hypothetical protein M409DRAFT_66013 [Zasmidium cellare ATCC 36951]|uniref:ferric-chelate reductase (NADPH) n=1 Tax=Zasmidium cellare ATCC 36951 TaxID=1080233 RepID=A0A6A6CJJ0_ZASCE|nr:uncharacterized protein M409DRAFT_66013 [Zasmidium cellare ATCC 36951]KAF2167397.1 hypothetical protein M409DRAFT_66013 [Zasmidium cellare ATCC 36951]